MGLIKNSKDLDLHLGYLKSLAIGITGEELKIGGHKTYPADDLKRILLETGGEVKMINRGTVHYYEVKKKHLGVGVYNVWLELKEGCSVEI